MSNYQKLFYIVIACCLLVSMGATSATATQPSATTWLQDLSQSDHASGRQTIEDDIPEGYDLISQNETFELYANQETLAFKVLDKRNGYIWHSNLDEKIDGDRLNKTWTAFANSAISIEFIDQKVSETRASITNAEHTIVFTETSTGFQAVLTFTEPLITITLVVSLHKDGVTVEIPFDGIQEQNPDFRIAMMHVYPWFGAMRTESTGYMFIPDGSGSLIRFQPETKAQNPFYGRYYADDLGMITGFPYDPTVNPPYKISIPVIGMVHEEQQSGYIAIVEKGASYAEFRAHPAGIITNFNFLYNTFVYNQSYFQATNRSGAGVTVLQPATNQFDIKINYRFLAGEESNYVGMARSYQKYLIEKGDLTKQIQPTSDIGIRLEFLGGDYERVLFWKRMIPMTTLTQMSDILNSLEINNPEVIYYGWQPLGASSMPPRSIKLDSKLGDTRQLNNLLKQIQGDGGQFYLYLDPLAAFMDEPGYSTQGDLAMSVTNYNVVSYNRNKVNFFRNFPALESFYSAISRSVDDQFVTGFALDGISSNLYSDFKRGNFLNREQAIQSYQELLTNTGIATSFYSPNDYLFRFMRAFYDIPVSDSGYIYFTDTIPFLQIVFAGYIPVYGNALNFSSNLQEDLLRHADFGVWPSYFLTHEVTAKILDTGSNWIYTSSIGQWDDQVESTYQWLNSLLGPVKGAQVISREELSQDVFATTYTNGQMIIVNYSTQPFTEGNIRVGARDAVIVEVTP